MASSITKLVIGFKRIKFGIAGVECQYESDTVMLIKTHFVLLRSAICCRQ